MTDTTTDKVRMVRMVRVDLTEAEVAAKGRAHAAKRTQRNRVEAEMKDSAKSYKERIRKLDKEADELRRDIQDSSEERAVECYEDKSYATSICYIRRCDNDVAIESHPITFEECQENLFGGVVTSLAERAVEDAKGGLRLVENEPEPKPDGEASEGEATGDESKAETPTPETPTPETPTPETPTASSQRPGPGWFTPSDTEEDPVAADSWADVTKRGVERRRVVRIVSVDPDGMVTCQNGQAELKPRTLVEDDGGASNWYGPARWTNRHTKVKLARFRRSFSFLHIADAADK